MLIVLEGPDRAGKSTLVRHLALELRRRDPDCEVHVLRRGVPTAHPVREYEVPLWSYRAGTHHHVICDRWHVGEVVYPVAYGRPTQQTPAVRLHVELLLRARGALLVHVTQAPAVLHDRVEEERAQAAAQVPADVERVNLLNRQQVYVWKIHELFNRALADAVVPSVVATPDCPPGNLEETARQLVDRAADLDREVVPLRDFVTYVGPPRPRVLLLGDVRGPRNLSQYAPAFVPTGGTSGAYLLTALARAANGYPPLLNQVGVANACDVDHVRSLLVALGQPAVVSLGRNAADELTGLHVPHVELPHPQWVRRFWHRRQLAYGRQVLGIVEPEPLEAWVARPWNTRTQEVPT